MWTSLLPPGQKSSWMGLSVWQALGISSINMALEINGVVYTGMGPVGCFCSHGQGIYAGMEV